MRQSELSLRSIGINSRRLRGPAIALVAIFTALSIQGGQAFGGGLFSSVSNTLTDIDPTNQNNNWGVKVHIPITPPRLPRNNNTPTVISEPPDRSVVTTLDRDGWIYDQVGGGPPRRRPKKAEKIFRPDGTAKWKHDDLEIDAYDKYDSDEVKRNREKKEAADRERIRKKQKEQEDLNRINLIQNQIKLTPDWQIQMEVERAPTDGLLSTMTNLRAVTLVLDQKGIDTSGLRRLTQFAGREFDRRREMALRADQQQPLSNPSSPPAPEERPQSNTPPAGEFAQNLGIEYERVDYDDGTFGVKVIRPPAAGSPAAKMGLEPGDIILELDGQKFGRTEDVLNHRQQTTVLLIDVRTNQQKTAEVFIP